MSHAVRLGPVAEQKILGCDDHVFRLVSILFKSLIAFALNHLPVSKDMQVKKLLSCLFVLQKTDTEIILLDFFILDGYDPGGFVMPSAKYIDDNGLADSNQVGANSFSFKRIRDFFVEKSCGYLLSGKPRFCSMRACEPAVV